jgi:hypothetical protein
MAAVIGVLAVLGIEGDVLDRLIRDHPQQVAVALTLAVAGVVIGVVAKQFGNSERDVAAGVGGILVAAGAILAIWFGAVGVGEREQPDIDVTPLSVDDTKRTVSLEVVAKGTHLRSSDRMLLRVTGVQAETAAEARRGCGNSENIAPGVGDAYWGESGPDLMGRASTTAVVQVSKERYDYACAFAALLNRPGDDPEKDGRRAVVIVELDGVQPTSG